MGPNIEADEKSAYNNVQVGVGPQQREIDTQFLQAMQVGGAPTQRNGYPISTGNVSWGGTTK